MFHFDDNYDAIVVGAGPAGSMTAKFAARSGARVLVVEKRQEIGSPVRCGESIDKAWLDDVGILPSRNWIVHSVVGQKLVSPNGTVVKLPAGIAGDAYAICRDAFDRALAEDASRAGADIVVKCNCKGILKEGKKVVGVKLNHFGKSYEVHANVVVGADGFESQVGRWAGLDTTILPSEINVCFEYTLAGIECDYMHNVDYLGSIAPGGMVWVLPRGKDVANVGIGVMLSKVVKRGEAKSRLDRFIKTHPSLAGGRQIKAVAGAVSLSKPKRFVGDGIMLVGDAARQILPASGGGVEVGCVAGMLAGKAIGECKEAHDFSNEMLSKYEVRWRERYDARFERDYAIKAKFVTMSDRSLDSYFAVANALGIENMTFASSLAELKELYRNVRLRFSHLFGNEDGNE